MRIVILALGTRGDVQPHVALGRGLKAAGYAVTLLALDDFEALIRAAGLDFFSAGFQMADLSLAEYQAASEAGSNVLGGLLSLLRGMRPLVERVMRRQHEACQQADALIGTLLGMVAAREYMEAHPIPYAVSMVLPASRTRAFPSPILPNNPPPGSLLNLLTHLFIERFAALATGWGANLYRRACLGLPPRPPLDYPHRMAHGRPIPWLFAHSPAVVPHPADWPPPITPPATGLWTPIQTGSRPPIWRPSWRPARRRSTSASAAWPGATPQP